MKRLLALAMIPATVLAGECVLQERTVTRATVTIAERSRITYAGTCHESFHHDFMGPSGLRRARRRVDCQFRRPANNHCRRRYVDHRALALGTPTGP